MTGVDTVEKALHRARERVDEADVEMRRVRGDVTALRQADVGSGFRLVLDTGTFHGRRDADRAAVGREVSAIAAPDATVLLDCFAPRRRGPLPRGASRAAVEAAFPGWDVTDVEVAACSAFGAAAPRRGPGRSSMARSRRALTLVAVSIVRDLVSIGIADRGVRSSND